MGLLQPGTNHYNDVIMSAITSQITSLTIVYSTVYSGADQRKHQIPALLAFVWGIHWWPVNSMHKWPVTRKMFPFDDVIMCIDIIFVWSRQEDRNFSHACTNLVIDNHFWQIANKQVLWTLNQQYQLWNNDSHIEYITLKWTSGIVKIPLVYWASVTHIYVIKLNHHWFR